MTMSSAEEKDYSIPASDNPKNDISDFHYELDRFDDIRVLRFRLPGFEKLSLRQKKFIWYLSRAALAGRDIIWDQNFRYNLLIRKTFEAIIESYRGNRQTNDFNSFMVYARKVFFANGIHHHYSSDKMIPPFSPEYLKLLVNDTETELLTVGSLNKEQLADGICSVLFSSNYMKKTELKAGVDLVTSSSSNFYEGVTQSDVESFYAALIDPSETRPVSTGLNSRLVKMDGVSREQVYRSGGRYGEAIDQIIYWLELAGESAETEAQASDLSLLRDYYRTGSLEKWDQYNCAWAKNNVGVVDYINGFIETYEDPLGMKATWESVVQYADEEATLRSLSITENAQWFEDNSPVDGKYRKEKVTGVAARVTNVAMLGGDCYPSSPLGINLPNADWIRKDVGSKSVRLANIADAYDTTSRGNGFLEEYAASAEEIERQRKYGTTTDALHTDLHECVGHASGKLAEDTDPNALKNYASTLEEMRADLFALFFIVDEKMINLGLLPDIEAGKTEYDSYIRNGLITQLVRIKKGKTIEEAHMRCRAAIAQYVYEKGLSSGTITMFKREGKTFVKINDYLQLRSLFGDLLKEVQRIKSEGDYESGKKLVEAYGVNVDGELHEEVLERYAKLNLAPYTGFVNPELMPVYDETGAITDIVVNDAGDYLIQMMNYGKNWSFLDPVKLYGDNLF